MNANGTRRRAALFGTIAVGGISATLVLGALVFLYNWPMSVHSTQRSRTEMGELVLRDAVHAYVAQTGQRPVSPCDLLAAGCLDESELRGMREAGVDVDRFFRRGSSVAGSGAVPDTK